jgi:hypothetical protein
MFDFSAEAPIICFFDTRGHGEVAYDPSENIDFCNGAIAPYNIDPLWAKLVQMMPDAKHARLLHTLKDIGRAPGGGKFGRRSPTRVALWRGHF